MPRFDFKPTPPPPIDVSFARGWTVDIWASQGGIEQAVYRDCSLQTLVRASALFERLALEECSKPLAYGQETKIKYILPRGVAAAAFKRILDWVYAINEISGHGEIEDPQITTMDGDGLTQYLRLFQAANLLELKYPLHNQKRLPDMIKATIKKAFDTKNNSFKHITITDREIGLIWDAGSGNRNDSIIKLMLALFVDAYDFRRDFPKKFKDDVVPRFDALMAKNAAFKSAVIDVKTKKDVRLREEERERKGLPKQAQPQKRGAYKAPQKGGRAKNENARSASWDDGSGWRGQVLTDAQANALMSRPEEFQIAYHNGHGTGDDGQVEDGAEGIGGGYEH